MQVDLCVELDDVEEFDPSLAESIQKNTKRYVKIVSDAVQNLLPDYKSRDVINIFAESVLDSDWYIYLTLRVLNFR